MQTKQLTGFPSGSVGKESACNAGDLGVMPGSGRSLEKEMATHSSISAWKIPWTEELGREERLNLQNIKQLMQLNIKRTTNPIKKMGRRTSLAVQWLRICLLMQETWVQSLVREDSTHHEATRPLSRRC